MSGRWFLWVLGAAAVLGALIALALPLSLHVVDRTGQRIPCGNGYRPSYEVSDREDALNRSSHDTGGPAFAVSDYGSQCSSLVAHRRLTVLGVAGVGAIVLGAGFVGALPGVGQGRRSRAASRVASSQVWPPMGHNETTWPISRTLNAAR